MSKYLKKFFNLVKSWFTTQKGRPIALIILTWLTVNSLVSEWPLVYKPALVSMLEQFSAGPFQSGQRILLDSYQRQWPRVPESQPVTIVAIDESSLAQVGQWPWPRNRMAELIDKINAMQPLAIGIDIYMPEPDQTSPDKVADNLPPGSKSLAIALKALPSHETVLAKSLQAAPTVLGAAGFDHEAMTTSDHLVTAPFKQISGDARPFVKHFDHVLASLPQLQTAAHGQALLSVSLEDGVVRRLPMVMSVGNTLVPSLPMEMLRVATKTEAIEVSANASGIQTVGFEGLEVPTLRSGDIFLHYALSKATNDRYVSAKNVLDGKVDPERFQNKLVLIGLTGAGLQDMRTTALGELVPGIEIQAQAIESIFEGKFLERPLWLKWVETGFLLGFGLLMIWYVPRTDSRFATFLRRVPRTSVPIGILINAIIISSGFILFAFYGLFVDASSIFIVVSAVMSSLIASAVTEIESEQKAQAEVAQIEKEKLVYQAGLEEGLKNRSQV
jgi:adenylate cyclase